MILRYRLEKFHNALVFQVLYMTPTFRLDERHYSNTGRVHRIYVPSVRLNVESSGLPELNPDTVFLCGTERGSDTKVVVYPFAGNSERDKYFNRVQTALRFWVENPKLWVPEGDVAITPTPQELKRIPGKGRCFELHVL